MKILFIIILGLVTFGLMLIGNKNLKQSIIYMLAIGGAVNANFYTASNLPIICFGYPFGVDSVIYALFIFCCFVVGYFYNFKAAITLLFSTMAAILFSAITQLVAQIASIGFQEQFIRSFLSFIFSILGSIIAVVTMLYILKALNKTKINVFLILIICLFSASIINSIIYYGLTAIMNKGIGDDFFTLLLTSTIGKSYGMVLSIITMHLLILQYKKNEQIHDEEKIVLVEEN